MFDESHFDILRDLGFGDLVDQLDAADEPMKMQPIQDILPTIPIEPFDLEVKFEQLLLPVDLQRLVYSYIYADIIALFDMPEATRKACVLRLPTKTQIQLLARIAPIYADVFPHECREQDLRAIQLHLIHQATSLTHIITPSIRISPGQNRIITPGDLHQWRLGPQIVPLFADSPNPQIMHARMYKISHTTNWRQLSTVDQLTVHLQMPRIRIPFGVLTSVTQDAMTPSMFIVKRLPTDMWKYFTRSTSEIPQHTDKFSPSDIAALCANVPIEILRHMDRKHMRETFGPRFAAFLEHKLPTELRATYIAPVDPDVNTIFDMIIGIRPIKTPYCEVIPHIQHALLAGGVICGQFAMSKYFTAGLQIPQVGIEICVTKNHITPAMCRVIPLDFNCSTIRIGKITITLVDSISQYVSVTGFSVREVVIAFTYSGLTSGASVMRLTPAFRARVPATTRVCEFKATNQSLATTAINVVIHTQYGFQIPNARELVDRYVTSELATRYLSR